MVDYTKIAFSSVRSYLWDNLKSSNVLDDNDYWVESMGVKLNPIIPSRQIPEFQNLLPGVPYIIYDIETLDYGEEFWITDELVTFTIVGTDYGKLHEISQLIKDLFRRYDISANEINNHSSNSTFRFLKTYITGMMSPSIESESDVQSAIVEITYCYTRDIGPGMRML